MKYKLSILFLFIVSISNAQTSTSVVTSGGRTVGVFDNIYGAVIPVIKPDNTDGSPFLSDDWNKGTVVFKKGKRADSLPLKFDIVNNKVYFKQDSLVLEFLEEVSFFRFNYQEGTALKTASFKNGYPEDGALNSATFYQVFAEGSSYHLLKHLKRIINEEYVYNDPAKSKYVVQDVWYVFDVKKMQLMQVKPNKAFLKKKLKADSDRIDELCQKNKWDLKTTEELVALFTELNKE
jgi:hypothetical protein